MKLIRPKYYKNYLKYRKVPFYFEGSLKYVADFHCGGYVEAPCAVWHNSNPDREKGHKDYLLIFVHGGVLYVSGKDAHDMHTYLNRNAIHCLNCDEVVYSMHRHDFRPCSCGGVSIDGGSDYTKIGYSPESIYEVGKVNLKTRIFKKGEI